MEIYFIHKDIKEFLDSYLDKQTKARYAKTFELLTIEEYRLSMPYSRKIENGLYELRIKSSQNIRIFYTFYNDSIVFLHVISKKTEQLNKRDIEVAKQRMDWLH